MKSNQRRVQYLTRGIKGKSKYSCNHCSSTHHMPTWMALLAILLIMPLYSILALLVGACRYLLSCPNHVLHPSQTPHQKTLKLLNVVHLRLLFPVHLIE
jgi:hypothetical protein